MKEMNRVVEYQIIHTDGTESITECRDEAMKWFNEAPKSDIDQFFSKEWIVYMDSNGNRNYEETDVELFYPVI